MIATLGELVAPLPVGDLRRLLSEREMKVVRRTPDAPQSRLVDWDQLEMLATTGEYPATRLRMTKGGDALPAIFYREGPNPRPAAIRQVLAAGGSALMIGVEPYIPSLKALCAAITAELGEKVVAGTVQSAGPGGAVNLHYDKSDVIAFQIEGRKRWLIGRDPILHPVPGMSDEPRFDHEDVIDVTLDPGDMLVLPAGVPHHCENLAERSLHLTFFVYPMTAPRLLDLMFREMIKTADGRRPFRFPADDPAAQEELRELVIARIRETNFDDLLARHFATDHSPRRHND